MGSYCSASAAVIVRLAYIPTFRDPEFLYATVPIAIWSGVEMSLAITAGSLPTLRPLYRVAARQFSWKTNFFSTQRSYGMMPDGTKKSPIVGGVRRQESCSESERNIVHIRDEQFALEERRRDVKDMRITKVTNVQVKFEGKEF